MWTKPDKLELPSVALAGFSRGDSYKLFSTISGNSATELLLIFRDAPIITL